MVQRNGGGLRGLEHVLETFFAGFVTEGRFEIEIEDGEGDEGGFVTGLQLKYPVKCFAGLFRSVSWQGWLVYIYIYIYIVCVCVCVCVCVRVYV